MKELIISVVFICLASIAWSQSTEDVLYLKNGSVFRGEVIELIPNEKVTFRTRNGLELSYNYEHIEKIVQEPLAGAGRKGKMEYSFQEKGIYNASFLNNVSGTSDWGRILVGLGAQHVTGYQFNRWIGLGAGIGLDTYELTRTGPIMPVFGEARGYFLKKQVSPYYSLSLGYGFGFKNAQNNIVGAKGGLFYQPALGFRAGSRNNANFTFDVGYRIQKMEYEINNNWEQRRETVNYHRFLTRIGILF